MTKIQDLTNSLSSQLKQPEQSQEVPVKKTKPTPLEGFAKLAKNPKYQAMSPEEKMETRGKLYDKYVVPYYKSKGATLPPEHREMFIRAGIQASPEQGASYSGDKTNEYKTDILGHFTAQVGKQGIKTLRGAGEAADRAGDVVSGILMSAGNSTIAGRLGGKLALRMREESVKWNKALDEREDAVNKYLGSDFAQPLTVRVAEAPIRAIGSAEKFMIENPEYLGAGKVVGLAADGVLGAGALSDVLANGTLKQKMAYSALKGAAEGLLVGSYEGQKGQELAGTSLFFGEAEAAGPLAHELKQPGVEAAKKFLSKLLVWGGPTRVEQALSAATGATAKQLEKADPQKLTTKLTKATAKAVDDISQGLKLPSQRDPKTGRFVSTRAKAEGVAEVLRQANAEAAVHNPELVELQAAHAVKESMKNPMGAGFVQGLQAMGFDPVKEATKTITKSARIAAGDFSQLKAKVRKGLEEQTEQMFSGLGPGAASSKESDVIKNLVSLVETNIPFQKKWQTLTFMWGVHKSLPKSAMPPLVQVMKDLYGPDLEKWDKAATKLDLHLDKMIATGHITPHDMRGVFASTKLAAGAHRTVWQKQLDAEYKQVLLRRQSIKKAGAMIDKMLPGIKRVE